MSISINGTTNQANCEFAMYLNMYKQCNEDFDWANKAKELQELYSVYRKIGKSERKMSIDDLKLKIQNVKNAMEEHLNNIRQSYLEKIKILTEAADTKFRIENVKKEFMEKGVDPRHYG